MKEITIKNKKIYIYNQFDAENKELPIVIYNTFGGNGKNIWDECLKINAKDFIFVVISDIDWDNEMTPWEEPPLFRSDKEGYDGLADKHLNYIINDVLPEVLKSVKCKPKEYILSGYSLGGLFSSYAMFNNTVFSKYLSASGSLWYPNFMEYVHNQKLNELPKKVYLSLGDREKNTKDMSKNVEDKTKEFYEYLMANKINTIFEMNEGNHFKDIANRIAKGIKWIIE